MDAEDRACRSKKAYPTQNAARRGVRIARWHEVWHAEELVPYLCPYCHQWHNGSVDPTDRARYRESRRIAGKSRPPRQRL